MTLINNLLILNGKFIIYISKLLNLGSGSTWPGHIALKVNKNFCKDLLSTTKAKKIVIAGTNGKTTTGKLITSVLEAKHIKNAHNQAGANLINGLASTLISNSNFSGRINQEYIIFESDEFALPQILEEINPDYLICLNLFRDQLDRYGELDTIARKWKDAIKNLGQNTKLILNADDPLISYLGEERKNVYYFGLEEKENLKNIKHGADSIHCPKCSARLAYDKIYFSHLGNWSCPNCGLIRPKPKIYSSPYFPLDGLYNKYNILAAYSLLKEENISDNDIITGFKTFLPAFGRQEQIKYKDREIMLLLSKNPTSFNESLSTAVDLGAENLMFILNDRIPDGLDVSWIWDIGIERILNKKLNIAVSGDRCFDMGLRLKYAGLFTHIEPDASTALDKMVDSLEEGEKLYILPNYSAMLDIRKVLLGRKLL